MSNPYNLAKEICTILFNAGYTAYFAGGWVRDLLLEKETDEIDIATNAPPEIIQHLFTKTIPVGVAFGVVIVVFEGVNFEVTTFRKDHPYHDGRHPDGVDFSTSEKDALRRDFTINGLFYDPLTETIYDYVQGRADLEKKIIRAIGTPAERFAEDRLRMIRAVRFAARLRFKIDSQTYETIKLYASSLFPSVSMERIWQELSKMAAYPHFDEAVLMLHELSLLEVIFPQLVGLERKALEAQVAPWVYFPPQTPTIVFLLELFPQASLEEKLQLCLYLKTTQQDRKLVEFFSASNALCAKEQAELYDWAHFYAHPLADLYLKIAAAKILPPERVTFLHTHTQRQKALKRSIHLIENRQSIVTAHYLQQAGIPPGKTLGLLLKEAERLAINHSLTSPEQVLTLLRQHPLWPAKF